MYKEELVGGLVKGWCGMEKAFRIAESPVPLSFVRER